MKNNGFLLVAVICAALIVCLSGGIVFSLLKYGVIATVFYVLAGVSALLLAAVALYAFFTRKKKK
ncbi:MAG: hypothetical protein DBX59_11110 [Bacillota bacterium]|nr:MAG: hypothetical protein DBX59_11110 [Bacillota bacterium]